MQQENINLVLDATELKWLDVTYTAKKYLETEQVSGKKAKRTVKFGIKKAVSFGAIAVGCLAVLLTFTFVKGNFDGNFLQIAKATATSSLLGQSHSTATTLTVPCNMQVDSVQDGVIVLSGGKALTSLSDGTVIDYVDGVLTVAVDDNVVLVYNGLVNCFVSAGDVVSNSQLLGRYDGSVSASLVHDGQVVQDVVASPNAIKWSV